MTNEELMLFLKKNVISVSCVIASILIGVALYARSDQLPDAEKILADKAQQGELLAANIEDSAQLKEQHAALVSANSVIADRMIRVGQLAENLQYFYRLESETGTKLTDPRQNAWVPPAKNAAKTNFTLVNFNLGAQGDYTQVLDLLRKLEDGEHFCRVNTLTMKPVSVIRGGPVTISVTFDLLALE
ncbi:MAG TPA: hypothetical protein VFE25_15315 [Opitutaceae bacterium]|jgi:hypothetical protein|nr:hypothetical protein [Opitutaceae bacterium]